MLVNELQRHEVDALAERRRGDLLETALAEQRAFAGGQQQRLADQERRIAALEAALRTLTGQH